KTSLLNNTLSFFGGWKGEIHRNTYRALSSKNPFIHSNYNTRQTKSMQLFAGIEAGWGDHFKFGSTVSRWEWNHLALFVNDYAFSADGKQFNTVYDNRVTALGADVYAQYQYGEVFGLKANITWMNYVPATHSEVWHEPAFRFGGSAFWRPVKQ